ncbi:ABC-2 type transport system permease protein [Nocardioides ginsengisegetis]|uniref:ABC-2 type transport system permease protein n=1 Tax=Nocardioides ginsengisegetis TaxID=661491 RepID=A0A7W3IZ58_9ACTN|nr:ABC antibiotics transporter [Nocardioides ginsengisegetis]MBA8803317.1 ABC-2 type transport system permease protein [Nocardioides ginsengisegetis]
MNALSGTIRLTRLAARRDRVTLSIWVLGLTAFLTATTAMFVRSLVTHADVVREAQLPTSNVGLRLLGLTSGPSVGGAVMVRDYVWLMVMAALMNVFAVVRHTRQSEELGRAEVVGSTVVGRYADLAAAVIVVAVADTVMAGLLGLAMVVNGQPVAGAFTAGAGVAAVGLTFAAVAAVTVQLASTSRAATGFASAVLAGAFLLSGIGNMLGTADLEGTRVNSAWPAWLSPLGWAQQMRPFGGDHVWPLAIFVALVGSLLGIAGSLVVRRDVGAGLWPQRRGHAHAAAGLLSPAGLDFRLQRGALLGWAVGMLAFGLIFGAMSAQIQDVTGQARDFYERFGGADQILEAYDASMAAMGAMIVAIYVVQMVLRMRADEAAGTLESLLASGVSRPRWVLGHLLNSVGGGIVLMLLYSAGMGIGAGQALGDTPTQLGKTVAAGLVQLPAILVVGACALAAIGLLPRLASPLAWAIVIAALLLGPMFGPALGLPERVMDVSPFTHVPSVPATGASALPLLVLTGTCLTLGVIGTAAVRRRSLLLPA